MKTAISNWLLGLSQVRGPVLAGSAAVAFYLAGCAGPQVAATNQPAGGTAASASAQEVYGIRVDGLHLSAHGYILDLRYRVLDPQKAAGLLNAKSKVYLIDEAHQAKLGVPASPIIGGMRQTSRNHVVYTDRDYFILFVNPGRAVRPGDTLKLAVDGAELAELSVQ